MWTYIFNKLTLAFSNVSWTCSRVLFVIKELWKIKKQRNVMQNTTVDFKLRQFLNLLLYVKILIYQIYILTIIIRNRIGKNTKTLKFFTS